MSKSPLGFGRPKYRAPRRHVIRPHGLPRQSRDSVAPAPSGRAAIYRKQGPRPS